MDASYSIQLLDESLSENGEIVILRRGTEDIPVPAKCKMLRADEITSRGGSAQTVGRAILSPTGLDGMLPITRNTHKLVKGGVERNIIWVNPVTFGQTLVRIELEFAG